VITVKDLKERLKNMLEGNGPHALYVYGQEGIGKRQKIMSALRNMAWKPVEVPLISTYTAMGNFLQAIWDHIPPADRSMYMGMFRGAVGRFFAYYVPTLAPYIEKMGIDVSRTLVNVELIYPHIANIINDISKDIVWVLNDYFAFEGADLRKFLGEIYKKAGDRKGDYNWDNIRIVVISEVDDPKVIFPRIYLAPPSYKEFQEMVGKEVPKSVYDLVEGNPGVYRILTKLADARGLDLSSYSKVEDVLVDALSDEEMPLYTALSFVSHFHVGRFGPSMRVWAARLLDKEDITPSMEFLQRVGLVESLDYLIDRTGIPIWRVQYTIGSRWISHLPYEEKKSLIDKSVCIGGGRFLDDGYFILSMHARKIGMMRRAHAYFILWMKHLHQRFYLQRILEILIDLGYMDNPYMLRGPSAAYIARFLYKYFGSHPALKKFAERLGDYVLTKPLLLSVFAEFMLLYGEVSSKEVDLWLNKLLEFKDTHRVYPVSVWVMWGIGRIYEEYNSYDTAEVYYRDGIALSSLVSSDEILRLELINSLGRVLFLQGKEDEAREQWVKLLEEAKAVGDPLFLSKAYNNLAVYESERSFRYSLELFRMAYEIAMGAGTTSAAVSLSNYLSGAYEIITEGTFMERLREARQFIESSGVPFYKLLFYSQTYMPLLKYRRSSLVDEWERFLREFFDDDSKKRIYAEKYVEVLSMFALARFYIDGDIPSAISLLKEAERVAALYVKSGALYVVSIYEAYMELGIQTWNKDIFMEGYDGFRGLDKEMKEVYRAIKMYFDGLKDHAIKLLSGVRRHYLRSGKKFSAGEISLLMGEIFYREGDENIALIHYRRALSEFEGLGAFNVVRDVMNKLGEMGLGDKLFAGISEKRVKQSIQEGSLGSLWKIFESVLDDVENEIFVYESVIEAYQKLIGKASVLDISHSLARSIRFFVSASTYVSIYRGSGKIGYSMVSLFPGGIFIPRISDYEMLSLGSRGWESRDGYSFYIDKKDEYAILIYIDKANLTDMDTLYVESIASLVLTSLPMLAERQHAIHDTLTGLYVRWYVLRRLDEEYARSRRERTPIAVLYMDIDNFKRVNDTFGHAEGDRVLRTVASIIKRECGPIDVPGRYGGEEFIVIVPGADESYVLDLAERIRSGVENEFKDTPYGVTISIGVAVQPPLHARSGVELLDMADKAMYYAKRHGKNRVVFATPEILREVKDGA